MSFEKKQNPDFWEQLDPTSLYRPLSPTSVDQYFSGEVDDVFISRDHGKWWVKVNGEVGETAYDTLEAAKMAGDLVVEKSDNDMLARMNENLGLADGEWELKILHGAPTATMLRNEDIAIIAGERAPRWTLIDGDNLVDSSDNFAYLLTKATDLASAPAQTM